MEIKIKDDFDLYKITYSGQCFRAEELNNGTYRFITGNNVLYIRELPTKTAIKNDNPEHIFDISCSQSEWDTVWSHYFDLKTNYKDIRASIKKDDQYLYHCAEVGSGIRILNQDKWEMLISFIISQRKSIPAIRSSVDKLCKLYGSKISACASSEFKKSDDELYTFPTPEQLKKATADELSACGLGYRVPYILDAIASVNSGSLKLDELVSLSDDELFEALKTVKGIGDKVSNCVALFAYHRIGRAPVDTWILKVINEQYNGINPFPSYGNVAGIMQQYIFYNAQHVKSDIR